MNLSDVLLILENAPDNFANRDAQLCKDTLEGLKREAILHGSEATSKDIWCYERLLLLQELYHRAFREIKDGAFYEGWCTFENAKQAADSLINHFKDETEIFHLAFIIGAIPKFQSIFPYRLFISPEMVYSGYECSICGSAMSVRNSCEHSIGEIYQGEICYREVTKVDWLGCAIVASPAHKYSVLFNVVEGKHDDQHDYTLIRFLAERLRSPYDGWCFELTKTRHPHTRFTHIGRNDACPCDSDKKYKKCCLPEEGVLRPHYRFQFEVMPPAELLTTVYT